MNGREPSDVGAGQTEHNEARAEERESTTTDRDTRPGKPLTGTAWASQPNVSPNVAPDVSAKIDARAQTIRTAEVLPKVAAEDDPKVWGDNPTGGYDDWLKEQRPPHWG